MRRNRRRENWDGSGLHAQLLINDSKQQLLTLSANILLTIAPFKVEPPPSKVVRGLAMPGSWVLAPSPSSMLKFLELDFLHRGSEVTTNTLNIGGGAGTSTQKINIDF